MARYALVIGIDSNQAPLKSLSKTRGDAEAIAQVLQRDGGFEVQRLVGQVKRRDLEQAIERLLEQAQKQEALIYYTGHAFPLKKGFGKTEAFLATSNCTVSVDREQAVTQQAEGLSLNDLNAVLGEADLGNLVLLLDCCHSGYLLEKELLAQTFNSFSKKDYLAITACRSFEQAYAKRSDQHSLFTGAVLAGLSRDNADPKTQAVTGDRLFSFVYEQLKGTGQEAVRLSVGRPIEVVRFQVEPVTPQPIDETNPYQGLLAFTAETAKFFFGRDRVVQDLVAALSRSNFVPLIGASGSGKSSVVRAGLMPRLEELGWRVLEPIKPGTEPLETLRSQISSLYVGDVIAPPVADAYPRIPGDEPILLVVDQFEEIFTLCRNPAEQAKFIDLLLNLPESGRIKAVITMRADFFEACLAYPALTQAIQTNQVLLSRMAEAELEAAIVNPAKIQGMSLQPKLLTKILQDVEAEENCLPLLEFALQQLWEQRSGTELTFDAYRKLGGVTGALNAHAEEIYKQLAARKQENWAKRVLLRLVRTGEGTKDTRQRQAKIDLLAMGKDAGEKEAISLVITALVDGRLLVSDRIDGQDVIDLSHEALMLSWKRFVGWRESDRKTRRLVDKIEDAKREWQTHRKRQYLLDGRLLKDAKRLLKDKPEAVLGAKAFIQKSLRWRRSQLAGLLLVPTMVLGIPAESFWREETVKRDYDRIERLTDGNLGERAAVNNLAGGCWAEREHNQMFPYFRERIFGNCRSLRQAKLAKANLMDANLSGADLERANLSGADIEYANLSGAYLMNANLSGANLSANLSGAYLMNANLSGASLSTDLSGANLSGASLSASLNGANLRSANLSGASLSVNLNGADFHGANLRGAFLRRTVLTDADLRAKLSGANFSSANLRGANFHGANLRGARFTCFKYRLIDPSNSRTFRECPNLEDIKWNSQTIWQGIKGWENVANIPFALKKQLKLKNVK
ncbi:pentapeptide repeat-containing protein [Leptolyngbya sp. FACHB-17]|uniref:nSTAND1 domain-containing NTPase n=1 Tax=unclassified Leptolyngbya TaxID=2650499 RepID=UPI001681863F|nr:pentapeptide repeat-containing protein [Leptolyngbya sp. FACHB-17]MBD2078710.1 pentapeptide repeat-containing protein [Leptolyngbya sp. FACHB-17]